MENFKKGIDKKMTVAKYLSIVLSVLMITSFVMMRETFYGANAPHSIAPIVIFLLLSISLYAHYSKMLKNEGLLQAEYDKLNKR